MTEANRLAQAMLGLQRWIPRRGSHIPGLYDASQPVAVQRDTFAKPLQPANRDAEKIAEVPGDAAQPHVLADGVVLTGHGVVVSADNGTLAWFLPLPWREKGGWQHWREPHESDFLEQVLLHAGLHEAHTLIRKYLAEKLEFSRLPCTSVSATQVELPANVKEVYAFSGHGWQHLVGSNKNGYTQSIDWQGRQVQVRCLPHPYRCLIDPASKKTLWQALIKINYET